jgi:hypothetical protein
MEIIYRDNNRILVKDSNQEININDNHIILYTGIYYKTSNEIAPISEIETSFIGIIECEKFRYDEGIIGIYVKPLYIWDKIMYKWKKIINYEKPKKKYFYYPHLLSLPNIQSSIFLPIYNLNTCINVDLKDYENIDKTFDLKIPE